MTLAEIKLDPSASFWLQRAARDLDQRDPVDAVNDAEALLIATKDKLATLTRV